MIGEFNPLIINPYWLVSRKLISEAQSEKITEQYKDHYLSHAHLSQYKLEYFDIQIIRERYNIHSTHEGHFQVIGALTKEIFTILNATPIWQLGINLTHHYEFNTDQEWHKFGDIFAPKEILKKVSKNPGLKKLDIKSDRDDSYQGEINIQLGLSEVIGKKGIKIQLNDHYNLYTPNEVQANKEVNASKAIEILEDFNNRIDKSGAVIGDLVNYATKKKSN